MNVSDQLLERLSAWGVRTVYGYPGDGINGIMGAFNRNDHGVRFIQARHEEMAAFMASGHAKFTDQVGVCLATSGPGAIHLLNGLYDAKLDHAPVVAIVGQSARSAIGGSYQQEVDLPSLFKDVASEYVHTYLPAAAGSLHSDGRFRLVRQLVRAQPEAPRGHDGEPLRWSGEHGPGRAVRHCREIRAPRSAGDRAGR